MKVFLFVLIFYSNIYASSDVDWHIVFDSCLNKKNKTAYCENLQRYEDELNYKFNAILSQDLSSIEKNLLTVAYYFAKDNVTLSWKINKNIYLNLSHKISTPKTNIIINYNF